MNWQQILASVLNNISAHAGYDSLIGMLLMSAIVRHMPPEMPNSFQALYTWFRSSVQEVVNQRSGAVSVVSAQPSPAVSMPPTTTEDQATTEAQKQAPSSTNSLAGLFGTGFSKPSPSDPPKAP